MGIDPGAGGGIAILCQGKLETSVAMPTVINKAGKRRIDAAALAATVRKMRPDLAFIELVGPMPRDGSAGSFWFGKAAGIPEGVLAALGVGFETVAPQVWKKRLAVPADKNAARARATRLLGQAELWPLVKDDGKAEAALIALYGYGKAQADMGSGIDW